MLEDEKCLLGVVLWRAYVTLHTYIETHTHTHTINMIKYNFLLVYYLLLLASLSNEPINNICGFMKFTLTESFFSAEKNHLPLLVGEVFSIWGHIKIFQAIRFT